MNDKEFKAGQEYFVEYHMAKFRVIRVDNEFGTTWIEYEVIEGSIPGHNLFYISSPFAGLCTLSN